MDEDVYHTWEGSCCIECEVDVSWCDNPPKEIKLKASGLAKLTPEEQRALGL